MFHKHDIKFLEHDVVFFSSGTASDSICPKGWRLPGLGGKGSYLELLKPYSNRNGGAGGLIQGDTLILAPPYSLIYSGLYHSTESITKYITTRGYYGSHYLKLFTIDGLRFFPESIFPQYDLGIGSGLSIRCLAR